MTPKGVYYYFQLRRHLFVRNISRLSIPSDDNNFEIPVYDLTRAGHPCNSKRGGVCVYYRNSLPLCVLELELECIVFELKIGNKFCKTVSLYRSPNQSQDEFETFTNNLELI